MNNQICDCKPINKELVVNISNNMLDEDKFIKTSNLFKILSDKTRLKILFIISQEELCVCDISYLCNMTKSAISHQLALLRKFSIVKTRREGKEVYYSLKDNHIEFILENSIKHINE